MKKGDDGQQATVKWADGVTPDSSTESTSQPRRNINERFQSSSADSIGMGYYNSKLQNKDKKGPHSDGYLPTLKLQREKNSKKSASKSAKVKGDTNSQDAKKRKSGAAPLTVDPKRFTIGSSAKREVIGGSNYSRSLLADARKLTRGAAPNYLRYLADVDHLFFKACKKFPPEIIDFNPKEKRGLWNSAGRCVYYLGLTDSYLFRKFRSGFTYKVVDYLGAPVLTSTGSQWNFGFSGYVSVTLDDGFLLGTMEQEFLGSNYNVKDGQGRIVLTIQAPCYLPAVPFMLWCCKEEFEICMDDGVSEIGKISRSWDDECPDFDGDLGIEFESEDDNRIKALLLGVSFLIEFQYYRNGGNGISYFFCVAILLAAVSFILSNGFGYYPEFHSFLIQPPTLES